jgi:hypothetical protein
VCRPASCSVAKEGELADEQKDFRGVPAYIRPCNP